MSGRRLYERDARVRSRRAEPHGAMFMLGAQLLTPSAAKQVSLGFAGIASTLRTCFCPTCSRHYMGVPTNARREARVLHIPCTDCKVLA